MDDSKRIVIGAVLLIVIVIAAVIAVKRTTGTPPGPTALLERPIEKIDIKTLEVVILPNSDWSGKHICDSTGFFKNPKTGTYSMVDMIKCTACGKLIPDPLELKGIRRGHVDMAVAEQVENEYICPRCGKPACVPEKNSPASGPIGSERRA